MICMLYYDMITINYTDRERERERQRERERDRFRFLGFKVLGF